MEALYPIQKEYWKQVQKNKNTRNTCGYPGINGGYFKNDKLLFGANCYGVKPKRPINVRNNLIREQIEQVDSLKYKDSNLKVSQFSEDKWSRYN